MSSLKESYHSNMSLAEAEKMVMQVLKGNMEEKITKENVEIMVVRTSTRQWERRTAEEMERMIATLA
jgi:20S proteasome alpha/beta subunit